MDAHLLTVLALVLFAAALLLVGASILLRSSRQTRSENIINTAIAARERPEITEALASVASPRPRSKVQSMFDSTAEIGQKWGEARIGGYFLEAEDKELLDRCGFANPVRARSQFVFARIALAVCLPLAAWAFFGKDSVLSMVLAIFIGFALGYMLPKWILRNIAAKRVRKAAEELPLLIDLLRLLQGVGLSIDQCLHVIVTEFKSVLPVLGSELGIAVNQHARGLSREQSLQRLTTGFGNEDLGAISRLIVQVDRHGGAVQEPLKQFAERVRERRKMELKERIGKLTVKMTGVMVLTLLPALLIVTAGAGFLALFRGLEGLVK